MALNPAITARSVTRSENIALHRSGRVIFINTSAPVACRWHCSHARIFFSLSLSLHSVCQCRHGQKKKRRISAGHQFSPSFLQRSCSSVMMWSIRFAGHRTCTKSPLSPLKKYSNVRKHSVLWSNVQLHSDIADGRLKYFGEEVQPQSVSPALCGRIKIKLSKIERTCKSPLDSIQTKLQNAELKNYSWFFFVPNLRSGRIINSSGSFCPPPSPRPASPTVSDAWYQIRRNVIGSNHFRRDFSPQTKIVIPINL